MLRLKRARRVRIHLADDPGVSSPSLEGLLVAKRRRELVLAVPQLITEAVAAGGHPTELESRLAIVPRERVLFWEEI